MHWALRNKWNQGWKEEVRVAWAVARPRSFAKPLEFSHIRVTLRVSRYFDHDGAYSAAKPLIDGLTEAGVIVDDSPKYVMLTVDQVIVFKKAEECAIIEIAWVDDPATP